MRREKNLERTREALNKLFKASKKYLSEKNSADSELKESFKEKAKLAVAK